ncbi:winged helix DNA-binding domain-containing protein [Microbacteriaceae bacterium VKM Ac-2854]|nr:winged helix DNA-binding domain-containing protein [Microbacteriaceae bacterium VKM Ac-2854]
MRLSAGRVSRLRLHSQGLVGERADTPADVARRMLALQGQDPASVLWSLGVRSEQARRGEHGEAVVRAAFDRGEIVRSWSMRGTLHAVAAEDLRLLLGVTADRQRRAVATRQRQLEVTEADIAAAADAARTLLGAGGRAARAELYAAFEAAGQRTSAQRGYHLIYALALDDVICLGPHSGAEQCFVLNEEWLPASPGSAAPDPDEALARIAGRYLASHGPASERDLSVWAKIPLTAARSGIAALGDAVQSLDGPGGTLWVEPSLLDRPDTSGVLLLPGFDELLLGYADRSAALPSAHAERIVPGGNGIFLATIVRDGRVVGTWRRRATTKATVIEPEPFEPLAERTRAAVRREAERFARFLGTAADLRWP